MEASFQRANDNGRKEQTVLRPLEHPARNRIREEYHRNVNDKNVCTLVSYWDKQASMDEIG